jgi:hypothetical protein
MASSAALKHGGCEQPVLHGMLIPLSLICLFLLVSVIY